MHENGQKMMSILQFFNQKWDAEIGPTEITQLSTRCSRDDIEAVLNEGKLAISRLIKLLFLTYRSVEFMSDPSEIPEEWDAKKYILFNVERVLDRLDDQWKDASKIMELDNE